MTSLLRSKQAGIERDLSAGLVSAQVAPDDLVTYGINSQVSALAYDPVQSLLAVGTCQSKYGRARVYVFGKGRTQSIFPLNSTGSTVKVLKLQFVASKLICLDSASELSVFSLETQKRVANHLISGRATTMTTDPMLDFAFIGTQSGDILMFDLDRQNLAPLRIPNLWAQKDPRQRIAAVESLHFHPRDIGVLLIGYTHGAVQYSFKQNKATMHYMYEVPRGAPGGDPAMTGIDLVRKPRLLKAVWHPTGTFILTAHEDGSLVFWDTLQARIVSARTITATGIHLPGGGVGALQAGRVHKEPIIDLAWCANQDPDDTALLISGGAPVDRSQQGLTLFEFGRTPVYATSSWEILGKHFDSPKKMQILPIPPRTMVQNFCLIPRQSPHFAGAQDPIAVLAILTTGEMLSLSFPSGIPISPTGQYHPSLTFIHPFIRRVVLAPIHRDSWLGMREHRATGPPILTGGSPGTASSRRYDTRNTVLAAHADGTVRIWDAGHADELENPKMSQVDVGRALGRTDDIDVTHMSLSGTNAEFAAGLRSGEVVIFRIGRNRAGGGRGGLQGGANPPGVLTDATGRGDPGLKDGFCPLTLLNCGDGPVTALRVSDVGFVAAATEGGGLFVIDLRGPAIIFTGNASRLTSGSGKSGRGRSQSSAGQEKYSHYTTLEFSVMTLEGDGYSSILLHAGSAGGNVATFKILPDGSGRYSVQYAGSNSLGGRVIHLAPINSSTGNPATASPTAVAALAQGAKVDGVVVAVTQSDVRVFRPPTSKGAHKSFDNVFCDAAAVARHMDLGHALVGVFGDGSLRTYSLPGLKEIGGTSIKSRLDRQRLTDAQITGSGEVFGWTGPSEMALLTVWGNNRPLQPEVNKLYNASAVLPPRPTISNLQWMTGTQYVTPADMEILIGGPGRIPSARNRAAGARQTPPSQQSLPIRGGAGPGRFEPEPQASGYAGPAQMPVAGNAQQTEGYMAYMSRQVSERTAKLGTVDENMQSLSNTSAQWVEGVGNFVAKQKRNLVMGAVKSKFGI